MSNYQLRERPLCRKAIVKLGVAPLLSRPGKWDGILAINDRGERSFLSSGMQAQMRKMLKEDFWSTPKERVTDNTTAVSTNAKPAVVHRTGWLIFEGGRKL
jgi:hypothetical protein